MSRMACRSPWAIGAGAANWVDWETTGAGLAQFGRRQGDQDIAILERTS